MDAVFDANTAGPSIAELQAAGKLPRPRILTQDQAEAVYSAMCALNNVNALLSTFIRTDSGKFIEVHDNGDEITLWSKEVELPTKETHTGQSAFAAAYGLDQDGKWQSAVAAAAGGLTQTAIER